MKKIICVIICFIVVLLGGCGGTEQSAPIEIQEDIFVEEDIVEEIYEEAVEDDIGMESLPEPVDIYVDFEAYISPDNSFYVKTNLPEETEIGFTLSGRGYLAQSRGYVNSEGIVESECFTNQGSPLPKGDYTLEVMMPIVNVQSDYVKHFIGSCGEYLQGPYIKPALGSVVAEKSFSFTMPQGGFEENTPIGVIATVDATVEEKKTEAKKEPEKTPEPAPTPAPASSSQSATTTSSKTSSTGTYYSTPTGKRYHLDPDCGGKNSTPTTNISGLTPCQKCANG